VLWRAYYLTWSASTLLCWVWMTGTVDVNVQAMFAFTLSVTMVATPAIVAVTDAVVRWTVRRDGGR